METIGAAVVKGSGIAIGKNVASSLINKINTFLNKNKTSEAIRELESSINAPTGLDANQNNEIKEKIYNRYLKFRTLIQPEKRVFIDDIYHPLSLHYKERNGITHQVDSEQVLFLDKVTIIVGKAGQGKTTTLRKIVLREMLKEGGYIPLIITLRTLEWEKDEIDICTVVSNEFLELGLSVHKDAVPRLLQSQSILLCFDGFDEVPTEYRTLALRLIRHAFHAQNSPCIVTTRPHTEILYEQGAFEIAELLDLTSDEVKKIIKKNNLLDDDYTNILVETLNNNPEINSILLTPILVDIYMSVFGSLKNTPKSEIDFYDELFWSLINKHDRFKAFVRPSKSSLTSRQLYKLFLRVSATIALKHNSLTFSEQALEEIFSNCAEKIKYIDHKNASHSDIIDKTSLIIADGNEFTYIHKTILEYHTAVWIKSLPVKERSSLYKHFADKYDPKLENILRYSSKIDIAAFNEYFAKYIIQKTEIMKELEKGVFSEFILGLIGMFNIIGINSHAHLNNSNIPAVVMDDKLLDKVNPLVALRDILNIPINNPMEFCTSLQTVQKTLNSQHSNYISSTPIPRYDNDQTVTNELKVALKGSEYYYKVLDIMAFESCLSGEKNELIQINHIKSTFVKLLDNIAISIAESCAESDIGDLM